MGTLFIVATPIGNLKDITLRALEVLKSVDIVLAEDTRVTKKLLFHFGIKKPVWRADVAVERTVAEKIRKELEMGRNIACVSDAGTPNISDPGAFIVRHIRTNMPVVKIVPIPGPSALTALISISGISADQFTFLGYPPHKKGRETFFKNLKNISVFPVVFYESPHRFLKTLENLESVFGGGTEIVIGRELTKIHEEIFRGNIEKAKEHFVGERKKGEFVIVFPRR